MLWAEGCIEVYCTSSDVHVQRLMQQIVVARSGSPGPCRSPLNSTSSGMSELHRTAHFLWVAARFSNPSFSLRRWAVMTAMAVRVSSHPTPHVIKCHYTLISLFICPLTSSSSLLLVGSRFANPWVLRRLQYTGMWKSNLSFHCADPWTLEDGDDDKTLTKLKLDSTLLPHNIFLASVGIEVKRENET